MVPGSPPLASDHSSNGKNMENCVSVEKEQTDSNVIWENQVIEGKELLQWFSHTIT